MINLVILLIFVILSFITNSQLIFSKGVIGLEGDWTFPIYAKQVQDWALYEFYAWNHTVDFGSESGSPGFILKFFLAFLSIFGLSGEFLSKFICMFLISLAGLSMYFLCQRLKLDKFPSLVAGIFYMFTPEMFNRICAGLFFIGLTYALIPLALVFFMELIQKEFNFKKVLLVGLISSFTLSNESALVLILFIFVVCCLLFTGPKKHTILLSLGKLNLILLILFLVHNHWLLPKLINPFEEFTTKISVYLGNTPIKYHISPISITNALRLICGHLNYIDAVGSTVIFWRIISFLPALFAFSVFLFNLYKYESIKIFFGLFTIIGITLVSISSTPFWLWVLNKIYILWGFRDSGKWIVMIAIGYAVLIGLCIERIFISLYKNRKQIN